MYRLAVLGVLLAAIWLNAEVAKVDFPMDWSTHNETAVDLSGFLDAPAGRDGFIAVKGAHLVKPDGSRFRIWGVNICSSACFPEKESAVAMADQLAKIGFNCIRFHYFDSKWSPLFDKGADNTRSLNEDALDRMDFFIAELKKRGIYVNINLNVARSYREGDGVRDYDKLGFAKASTYFNPQLIKLQQEYARQLLTHKNKYTGNDYCNEPAVATIEILNENSLLTAWHQGRLDGIHEPDGGTWSPIPKSYADELTSLYNQWLQESQSTETIATLRKEAGVGDNTLLPRLTKETRPKPSGLRFCIEMNFYAEVELKFFAGMKKFLKGELGVKAPLAGCADHNHYSPCYQHVVSTAVLDIIDGHGYWQHPDLARKPPRCENTPMVNKPLESLAAKISRTPIHNKPFTVSEVNHPFPHEFACEGFPILSSYALFHDWDGIYWFTWSNWNRSEAGEIPENAFFSLYCDPVKVANLMACGLMWHQLGVTKARETLVRNYTQEARADSQSINDAKERPFFTSGFDKSLALRHALRCSFYEQEKPITAASENKQGAFTTDTGEIIWSGYEKNKGLVTVNAPATEALIGYVKSNACETRHIKPNIQNEFCSIMLVPMDGKPIDSSEKLLLAMTGWCGNKNMLWDDQRKGLEEWGIAPTQIQPVTGSITLRDFKGVKNMVVKPLTAAGKPAGAPALTLMSEFPGEATFSTGSPAATMWLVEIVR
ncbi:MAG: cellulase family glycosylhydrolase [Kiritimatiellae bacterium]|nr:cellulase family glycosylhydrolase [Kiritimatiellia bacterium]